MKIILQFWSNCNSYVEDISGFRKDFPILKEFRIIWTKVFKFKYLNEIYPHYGLVSE